MNSLVAASGTSSCCLSVEMSHASFIALKCALDEISEVNLHLFGI